jgi:hypothetical protein
VENLWTIGALAVDEMSTGKKISAKPERIRQKGCTSNDSYGASLVCGCRLHKNRHAAVTPVTTSPTLVRYEDHINGRTVTIDVSQVGRDRWRAQVARAPGGRTALMPFYGATPDAAAAGLSAWLTRVSVAR